MLLARFLSVLGLQVVAYRIYALYISLTIWLHLNARGTYSKQHTRRTRIKNEQTPV